MTDETSILVSTDGPVTILTLNRPHRRNGMNSDMMNKLLEFFEARRRDQKCRVIILRASGDHFCPGADLFAETDGDRIFDWRAQVTG